MPDSDLILGDFRIERRLGAGGIGSRTPAVVRRTGCLPKDACGWCYLFATLTRFAMMK